MSWLKHFDNNSYIYLLTVVTIFFIAKIVFGWSYAQVGKKRDDKMPTSMTITNVTYISIFVIVSFMLGWSSWKSKFGNQYSRIYGKPNVFLVVVVIQITGLCGLIAAEILKTKHIVNELEHLSYAPAIATIFYVIMYFTIYFVIRDDWEDDKTLIILFGISVLFIIACFAVTFIIMRFSIIGNRIIDKNDNKFNIGNNDFNETFTTYSTVSMGDVAVMDFAVPFIVVCYVIYNLGNNLPNTYNYTISILFLTYAGIGFSKLIGTIIKYLLVHPRPCAFRMAGCNIANNKQKCKSHSECTKCGYNSTINGCSSTCVGKGSNLTSNCLCSGELNSYNDTDKVNSKCTNLFDRKITFNKNKDYSDSDKHNIVHAFTSMPSGHTISAVFLLVFTIYVLYRFSDVINKKIFIYYLLILLVFIYSGFVTLSRITDGWHSPTDCIVGSIVAITIGMIFLILLPLYLLKIKHI